MPRDDDAGRDSHEPGSEEVVHVAGDPGRLMEGEMPDTRFVEDCEHWITTYAELCAFKAKVLAAATEASQDVGPTGQHETSQDIRLMTAEHRRLVTRLDFWQKRRREFK